MFKFQKMGGRIDLADAKHTKCPLLLLLIVSFCISLVDGFSAPIFSSHRVDLRFRDSSTDNYLKSNMSGSGIEPEMKEESGKVAQGMQTGRAKVNEIDFCMAPSDLSISGAISSSAYTMSSQKNMYDSSDISLEEAEPKQIISLTRALNSASNRGLRRIMLSRTWPSAEALNQSFRQVLAAEKASSDTGSEEIDDDSNGPKCPIPRPVLNILMGRQLKTNKQSPVGKADIIQTKGAFKKGRTDEEWISDQIAVFSQTYGELPGYDLAEAYLECILSLATSGIESPKVTEVST